MERAERAALVLILLGVGAAAGWASFTHMRDWTLANSPAGTPAAYGWVNAAVSELVPIAALLTIRQRRRTGKPIGYPLFLLFAAAGLSLAAQLAVAKPGISGWVLSAVPALAFMALTKLVLSGSGDAPAKKPEPGTGKPHFIPQVPPEQPAVPAVPVPPALGASRTTGRKADRSLKREPEQAATVPRKRRPAAETRRLHDEIAAGDPTLTKEAIAEHLGITPRRLRTVLAAA
ncbi:hypothetical protein [Actinoplanes subglobosus]